MIKARSVKMRPFAKVALEDKELSFFVSSFVTGMWSDSLKKSSSESKTKVRHYFIFENPPQVNCFSHNEFEQDFGFICCSCSGTDTM